MTVYPTEATNPDALRYVELTRQRKARYLATNRRGGSIEVGEGDDAAFTPVRPTHRPRLMHSDGCRLHRRQAGRGRVGPTQLQRAQGPRRSREPPCRPQTHSRPALPRRRGGDAARTALPMAVQRSNDRLCTVSRTMQMAPRSLRPWSGHPSSPTTEDDGGLASPPSAGLTPLPSRCGDAWRCFSPRAAHHQGPARVRAVSAWPPPRSDLARVDRRFGSSL